MCGGAPEAPDLGPQAEASMYASDMAFKMQKKKQKWDLERWKDTEAMLDKVLGPQLGIMQEQWDLAKKAQTRFEEVFQPMEDDFKEYAESYDTPERRELERSRAVSQHQQTYDQQRQNAQRNLEAYGIDPSQTRTSAMDTSARISLAANQANAATTSDRFVEGKGEALKTAAINMGRGYPGMAQAGYGGAVGAGNSVMSNQQGAFGNIGGMMGSAQGWSQQGLAGANQAANIKNSGFQNELQAFNAAQSASPMSAIGDIIGTGVGVAGSMGFQEGGAVPEDGAPAPGPRDKVPAMLAKGEYVVPADVVAWKGEEFFEKLQQKSREGKQAVGQPPEQQGVPT